MDEKAGIQAPGRSQPVLPMMPGVPERRSRDYVRHGTTGLLAAAGIADGTVISGAAPPPPRRGVQEVPGPDRPGRAGRGGHLVCDSLATRKPPVIQDRLARHPRSCPHFTPAGSSWISQVERWSGFLTAQMIRRGVRNSVQALESGIRARTGTWNASPRPLAWTRTADEILDSPAKYSARISGAGY